VNGFLVDTNVVSELRRPRPSPRVLAFMQETPLEALFLSDIVVAEIRFGIETAPDAMRRDHLANWLETVIRPMFAGRLLSLTEDILLRWRLMLETGRRGGYAIAEPDLMLAATASEYGLTVVTRDTAPFQRFGVSVLDPWTRQR
jgi:predicted nucleic acid-binding protein